MISDTTIVVLFAGLAAYFIVIAALVLGGVYALANRRRGVQILGGAMLAVVVGFFTIPWGLGALSSMRLDRWIAQTVFWPEELDLAGLDVLIVVEGSVRQQDMLFALDTYAGVSSAHLLTLTPETITGGADATISDLIAQPGTLYRPLIGPPEFYWSEALSDVAELPEGIDLVVVFDRFEGLAQSFPALLGPLVPEGSGSVRSLHVFRGPGSAPTDARPLARMLYASVARPDFLFPMMSHSDNLPRTNTYGEVLVQWVCGDVRPEWVDFNAPPPVFCHGWF